MQDLSLVGKKVKIFFDDGNKVSYKEGTLKNINSDYVEFVNVHDETELINYDRVVRIEEKNNFTNK